MRKRVGMRYLEAMSQWRHDRRYRVPGEFIVVIAQRAI
jgi:hypothetical protein